MTAPTMRILPDGTEVLEWPGIHESLEDMPVVLDPFAKHGNHDQSSHGNWARGGGKYRTGNVIPGSIESGDFRVESDPDRRFTELWQRTYEGSWMVQTGARNLLNGREPLEGGNLFIGEPGQLGDNFVNDALEPERKYHENDLRTDVDSASRWMVDGLKNAKPGTTPLFRGTSANATLINGLREEGTVTLSVQATAEDVGLAGMYAERTQSQNGHDMTVVFRFAPETRRFELTASDWDGDHAESIVAGKFKVDGIFDGSATGIEYKGERQWVDYFVNLSPIEQPS